MGRLRLSMDVYVCHHHWASLLVSAITHCSVVKSMILLCLPCLMPSCLTSGLRFSSQLAASRRILLVGLQLGVHKKMLGATPSQKVLSQETMDMILLACCPRILRSSQISKIKKSSMAV